MEPIFSFVTGTSRMKTDVSDCSCLLRHLLSYLTCVGFSFGWKGLNDLFLGSFVVFYKLIAIMEAVTSQFHTELRTTMMGGGA